MMDNNNTNNEEEIDQGSNIIFLFKIKYSS